MYVVLLNGPKGSGKDTIASEFAVLDEKRAVLPVARQMQEEAMKAIGHPAETVDLVNRNGIKDETCSFVYHNAHLVAWPEGTTLPILTPRELYIAYGDKLRAEQGSEVFADAWLKQAAILMRQGVETLVMPDCRLQPEVNAAIRLVGTNRTLLVHVPREGCTWDNDIGSYCDHDYSYMFINNFRRDELGTALSNIVPHWRGEL